MSKKLLAFFAIFDREVLETVQFSMILFSVGAIPHNMVYSISRYKCRKPVTHFKPDVALQLSMLVSTSDPTPEYVTRWREQNRVRVGMPPAQQPPNPRQQVLDPEIAEIKVRSFYTLPCSSKVIVSVPIPTMRVQMPTACLFFPCCITDAAMTHFR